MKFTKPILAGAMAVCGLLSANGAVVINEVMQSCVYSMMDDLNDFPDSWVELYNSGESTVNLGDYKLGVKEKIKSAYQLPSIELAPGAKAMVYCDKVGEGMHASFRVDSGKGGVYLFDAEGNIVDQVELKKQPAPEVAYGRESDGSDTWGYELTPTPGEANGGGLSDVVLGNVQFSVAGGVWAEARNIDLELQLPKNAPEGAQIIYTLDGSEPDPNAPTVYDGPISITESAVVRAKAVAEGCISVPSDVNSYIFLGRDMELPVVSIVTNEDWLYDDYIGILASGFGGDLQENWRKDWRRPINIEYFAAEGEGAQINQLGETRVQGGLSRTNRLKSMAIYANKRFGNKNFGTELWAADKPGLASCKSFVLRNAGNDFDGCYMRDGLAQRVIGRNTNVDWQAYSPAVVYINGRYHAMMAVRERSNEDYVAANYDGLEAIDMFENWEELKAGEEAALDEFKDFVYGNHNFDEWNEYVNVESYANLMAINYWIYNTDFPMNNVVMWRRTDGTDGRWQWIIKDCDYGFGIWNETNFLYSDYDKFLYTNSGPSVGFDLYQRLMSTPEFKAYYIDRLVAYMGDFLNARTINEYMDEILAGTANEMALSHSVWGSEWSDLDDNMEFMREWISKRDEYMPTLMQEGWGLGEPVKVTVNMSLSDEHRAEGVYSYNGVALTQGLFDGYDYVGRTIKLSASGNDEITGWSVTIGDEHKTVMEPELTLTIEGTEPIVINVMLTTQAIQGVEAAASSIRLVDGTVYAEGMIEAYDMLGAQVAVGVDALCLPSRGVYVVRANGVATKVAW